MRRCTVNGQSGYGSVESEQGINTLNGEVRSERENSLRRGTKLFLVDVETGNIKTYFKRV